MDKYNNILAKSIENGGTTLKTHLESVAKFAIIAANYAGVDPEIARIGALLHDIGKASGLFQKQLHTRRSPLELNFRHEIASLFFLKLVDPNKWPFIIDMVIAHHKSIYDDSQKAGVIDLDKEYGDEILRYQML